MKDSWRVQLTKKTLLILPYFRSPIDSNILASGGSDGRICIWYDTQLKKYNYLMIMVLFIKFLLLQIGTYVRPSRVCSILTTRRRSTQTQKKRSKPRRSRARRRSRITDPSWDSPTPTTVTTSCRWAATIIYTCGIHFQASTRWPTTAKCLPIWLQSKVNNTSQ